MAARITAEMKLGVCLAACIGALTAYDAMTAAAPVDAQETVLTKRLDAIDMRDVPVSVALQSILSSSGLPGGIVLPMEGIEEVRGTFVAAPGWTLEQALNYLTTVVPSYKWEVSGDAVDFLPRDRLPPMLEVKIARFEFEDVRNGSLLAQRITELPEVRQKAAELGLLWGTAQTGLSSYTPPNEKPTARPIRVTDVTLLELLNSAARTRKNDRFWTYSEKASHGETYVGITF